MLLRFSAVVVVALGACNAPVQTIDPDAASDYLARSSVPSWSEYLAAAERTDSGAFVVEWDLWFATEDALRAYYDQIFGDFADKAHVWKQPGGQRLVWPGSAATNIRYCVNLVAFNAVNPSFGARAVQEMASETAAWEAVANIDFKYVSAEDGNCVSNNSNIDVAVGPLSFGTYRGCAAPSFANWVGTPPNLECVLPKELRINFVTSDSDAGDSTYITSKGAFRHELGHVLGFSHEHLWNGSSTCPAEITDDVVGLNSESLCIPYDSESVMHYPQPQVPFGPTHDYNISALDGVSTRVLYGMPVAWYVAASII